MGDPQIRFRIHFLRFILAVGLIGLCGLVLYCALRSSPRLAEIQWLPLWLTRWADKMDTFRHFVGFGALALMAMVLPRAIFPAFPAAAKDQFRHLCLVLLLLLIAVLELTQLRIPERSFDWLDIYWGWLGVLSARAVLPLVSRTRTHPRVRKLLSPGARLLRYLIGCALSFGALITRRN